MQLGLLQLSVSGEVNVLCQRYGPFGMTDRAVWLFPAFGPDIRRLVRRHAIWEGSTGLKWTVTYSMHPLNSFLFRGLPTKNGHPQKGSPFSTHPLNQFISRFPTTVRGPGCNWSQVHAATHSFAGSVSFALSLNVSK